MDFFEKDWLLTRVDFDKNQKPRLKLGDFRTGEIFEFQPEFEKEITLEIDASQRFCIGWHDLQTGADFLCPEKNQVDKKYEQCSNCQRKTGFNPAFYNAQNGEISKQQEERNSKPHFVYLAYFTDEIIKVGISFSGRGIARLLEQGARSALILGEFSTANIARNYEEKIAKMTGFCENVKSSVKMKIIEQPFDFEKSKRKLLEKRAEIERALSAKFNENSVLNLDEFYAKNPIPHGEIISAENCKITDSKIVFSGVLKAQIGYVFLAEQQGEIVAIPLRKFTGHKIRISPKVAKMELPERQVSLFDF